MISVCLVLFIHLLWHVTHVWLHVLQVLCQFSFLSFFLLFYCSCKVIIIIIIIILSNVLLDLLAVHYK